MGYKTNEQGVNLGKRIKRRREVNRDWRIVREPVELRLIRMLYAYIHCQRTNLMENYVRSHTLLFESP